MFSQTLRTWSVAWLVCACAAACSKPGLKVQRFPDGTRELTCDFALWKCIAQVDDYCKGASFEVIYAHDEQHLYGSPAAEVESRTSRAVVHCLGLHAKPLPAPVASTSAARPAPSAGPPPARAPVAAPTPARACLPGATQLCVGPGACSGGQACLADGSGFGNCDCGGAKAGEVAPASPPPK